MEYKIPYGKSFLTVNIPDHFQVDVIEPPLVTEAHDPIEETSTGITNLIGDLAWDLWANAKSVAIAINDKTRPVPHQYLLPPLLEMLADLGIPDKAIKFYIAVGTHPPMQPFEFSSILPLDILRRYEVISHDSEKAALLEYLGTTTRGTPVWCNRHYLQSDLKIVVGNIEPHQFMGFSGGVKSAAIGLAGISTINHNHALMSHPDSQLGEYDSNPARLDIEEIGQIIGVDLALNAILNQEKEIVHVLCGDPQAVMQAGIPRSKNICQVKVPQEYSLMLVSPGGHPKDINIYQSQKGLSHAARVTKPKGTIILAAACPEGSGSPHYEKWVLEKHSHQEVVEDFNAEGFRIGPHKAYQIAREALKFKVMLYSDIDEILSRGLLLTPIQDVQQAVDTALGNLQPGERIGILPHAASTIPYIQR